MEEVIALIGYNHSDSEVFVDIDNQMDIDINEIDDNNNEVIANSRAVTRIHNPDPQIGYLTLELPITEDISGRELDLIHGVSRSPDEYDLLVLCKFKDSDQTHIVRSALIKVRFEQELIAYYEEILKRGLQERKIKPRVTRILHPTGRIIFCDMPLYEDLDGKKLDKISGIMQSPDLGILLICTFCGSSEVRIVCSSRVRYCFEQDLIQFYQNLLGNHIRGFHSNFTKLVRPDGRLMLSDLVISEDIEDKKLDFIFGVMRSDVGLLVLCTFEGIKRLQLVPTSKARVYFEKELLAYYESRYKASPRQRVRTTTGDTQIS